MAFSNGGATLSPPPTGDRFSQRCLDAGLPDRHGGVQEWWREDSLDSSKHTKARRRSADPFDTAQFTNILLPPTPSELGGGGGSGSSGGSSRASSRDSSTERGLSHSSSHGSLSSSLSSSLNSSLGDEPDDHRSKWRLSFVFPWLAGGLKRKLPTILLLLFLAAGAFLLGRLSSSSAPSGGGGDAHREQRRHRHRGHHEHSEGIEYNRNDDESADGGDNEGDSDATTAKAAATTTHSAPSLPRCGLEYAVPGGSGFGGHNAAHGCVNAGAMSWPACAQKLSAKKSSKGKTPRCSAATWKGACIN